MYVIIDLFMRLCIDLVMYSFLLFFRYFIRSLFISLFRYSFISLFL